MIELLLPPEVVARETRGEIEAALTPAEREAVGKAVDKRVREFTTARACARLALAELGAPADGIPAGPKGEPVWPEGVAGSITHCDGFRAAAVARTADVASVGIDAEPNAPLPAGLLSDVAGPGEVGHLRSLAGDDPSVAWDRLLFSAKESVYKTFFPLTGRWLGFEDAELEVDPGGTFTATLLVSAKTAGGEPLTGFSGRWLCQDGLVLTAIARRPGTP
ncbi:MAG TPA: 4'-phosphopantetheinyl transferase superfamily protein [Solirubrobacterales bacterium]